MLPPIVPAVADLARSDAADHCAEVGIMPFQRRQRVLVGRAGADPDRVVGFLDARKSAAASSDTVTGSDLCCLVTHSPTSVPPATITASGWSSNVCASSSLVARRE